MAFSTNNSLTGVFQRAPSSGWAQQFGRVVIDLGSGQSCGFVLGEREHFLLHTSICREIRIHSVCDRSLEHDGTLLEPQSLCHFAVEVAVGCAQFCGWFAAIAVAMLLSMFCGMTHMKFCPDRFQSLCVSVVGHVSSEQLVFRGSWCARVPVEDGILFPASWRGHCHREVLY